MKTLKPFLVILFVSIAIISCKKEQKKVDIIVDKKETIKEFTIDESSIKMNWVAFKTTDKVAVKGEFTSVKLSKTSGTDAKDFLNGLEFSIPVSSIFSNNEERDGKLQKFFFGLMKDTELLSGSITATSNSEGIIHLNMNGITHDLPIMIKTKDKKTMLKGFLDLENWETQTAIESLNKACFDLHKGDDGISKTWNLVNINISFSQAQ